MKEQIEQRLSKLQSERLALADRLARMEQDVERARHTLSAYDGAIGELAALLNAPDTSEAAEAAEAVEE
jgi:hypothetical protein